MVENFAAGTLIFSFFVILAGMEFLSFRENELDVLGMADCTQPKPNPFFPSACRRASTSRLIWSEQVMRVYLPLISCLHVQETGRQMPSLEEV